MTLSEYGIPLRGPHRMERYRGLQPSEYPARVEPICIGHGVGVLVGQPVWSPWTREVNFGTLVSAGRALEPVTAKRELGMFYRGFPTERPEYE